MRFLNAQPAKVYHKSIPSIIDPLRSSIAFCFVQVVDLRIFECLSALSCAILTFRLCAGKSGTRSTYFVLAISAIIIICHSVFEHLRWQMSLLYCSYFVLLLYFALARANDKVKTFACRFGILGLAISTALSLMVPIVQLPAPQGQYFVGTRYFNLYDEMRNEILVSNGGSRRISIQVWYPTSALLSASTPITAAELAPYMRSYSDASPFLSAFPFAIAASHLPLIKTHSVINAPVVDDSSKFPVLIFSHGMMGGSIQNTLLAEKLAANGYIVFGIDHTYDCSFAIFDDKTICSLFMTKFPSPFRLIATGGLKERVGDVQFLIDVFEKKRKCPIDTDILNSAELSRLAVYGHSLGGQTSLVAASIDKRIKAIVSLDGVSTGQSSVAQPTMLLLADHPPRGSEFWRYVDELTPFLKGPSYLWHCRNFGHADFTDLPLLTPMHWILGLSGAVDPQRASDITNKCVLAFFNKYLKGVDQKLDAHTLGLDAEIEMIDTRTLPNATNI